MHTFGETSVRSSCTHDNSVNKTGSTTWSDKNGKSYGAKRCRNSFLKNAVSPLPPHSIIREDHNGDTYNLITQKNYDYLRDSYFRYAELMNEKAEHNPGRSIGEGISNLYHEMNALVGDSINLNYEEDCGCLYFNLWKAHIWGDYTLYYFPIKFVEELNPKLRRIAITFMHHLMKGNEFTTINNEDDMDWVIEMLSDDSENENPKDRKNKKQLLHSYTSGKAYILLNRVWNKSYYKNLTKAINEYDCRNDFEKGLIHMMKSGIEFTKPVKPIIRYAYDPFYDDEPDFLPMELGQQIRTVYDCNDMVTEYLEDLFNSNRQESYEILPTSTFKVTPQSNKIFKIEDSYPERFFKWADKFINYIR